MMRLYETYTLVYPCPAETPALCDLKAVFTNGDTHITVHGFLDGSGKAVLRFLPMKEGEWQICVSGLAEVSFTETCLPALPGVHGPVQARGTAFCYADGKPFYPFGTTVYALAHQEEELVAQTLASLKFSPFNKVRMCVFPKDYLYNKNEPPCYPFQKDDNGLWAVDHPDPAFWDRFESILDQLAKQSIQVDLILFHPYDRWGFSSLGHKKDIDYLAYLLRRFAALPNIWWSLANEYDLCLKQRSLEEWEEIEVFVSENDPFHHLLSCHNCFTPWDASRPAVTHASLQTKLMENVTWYLNKYQKPVMIDECCYEGDLEQTWGNLSGKEMTARFWRCVLRGGYCTHGETFNSPDDILWWAKGGTLHGESPKRIAFLRQIIESLPGPLTPMPGAWSILSMMDRKALEKDAALPHDGWAWFIYENVPRMSDPERMLHMLQQQCWAAHCGDDAFLWYLDLQCCKAFTLSLPQDASYEVHVLDTWAMTDICLDDAAENGQKIPLPAKEGIAILARRRST